MGMHPGAMGFNPGMMGGSMMHPHHMHHNQMQEDSEEDQARAVKRPRLVWTDKLHKKFEEVVQRLGVDKAMPKSIMQVSGRRCNHCCTPGRGPASDDRDYDALSCMSWLIGGPQWRISRQQAPRTHAVHHPAASSCQQGLHADEASYVGSSWSICTAVISCLLPAACFPTPARPAPPAGHERGGSHS
jgi:SHAQKYF class myb-like DNA-binding protein